ncbi:MAG: nucleoside hydrolase [Armatimonas sp.]
MAESIPVLFDTDIGNDIDDAVALAYLLRQPRCELLGVTTATGDVVKRAGLVEVICRAAGRTDVPVYAGVEGPLLHGTEQGVAQYSAIENEPHRTDYRVGAALRFLTETIRSRPGEIVLLATGPLTNIGLLFAMDPGLPALLRAFYWMGGVYTAGAGHGPGAKEWNALLDPVATALTLRWGGALTAVGLEVTMKCQMPAAECRNRFTKSEPLATVLRQAEVWFTRAAEITFHDPLAAALIFEPELCTLQQGTIRSELGPGEGEGLTRWKADPQGAHRIAIDVNPTAFFDHYFAVTGG